MARVVILTGAGISAESGIPTFRGSDGLWEGHAVEDVATPQGFARNPELVQRFYNMRRAALKDPAIQPNPAHLALAEWQAKDPGVLIVTQNVDNLHERAGSSRVLHMHGELTQVRCTRCGDEVFWEDDLLATTPCSACGGIGGLRPAIVWFGEIPIHMDAIHEAIESCDVFASIGTSGLVYPAAGLVEIARASGAHTVEFNLEETQVSGRFRETRIGPASQTVPEWVAEMGV